MSNVDIVRRSYTRSGRKDMDRVMGDMPTPKSCGTRPRGLPPEAPTAGLDEVKRNIFDPLEEDWWDGFTRPRGRFSRRRRSVGP